MYVHMYIQVLHEIVFGIGGITSPFSIYTMRPRRHISNDSKISDIVPISQTLVAEEDITGIDPVIFLSNDDEPLPVIQQIVSKWHI